jgi:hypothetical protein
MGILSSIFALMEKRVASARAARCILVLKRNPDHGPFVRRRNFFNFNAGASRRTIGEFQVTSARRAGIEGTHAEASAGARITPISRYWIAKSIIAACTHCCYQPSSLRYLPHRRKKWSKHEFLTLLLSHPRRLPNAAPPNSPTVSTCV